RVRLGRRSAKRRAPARCRRGLLPRRRVAVDGPGRGARGAARRGAERDADGRLARIRRGRVTARSRRREARLRRRGTVGCGAREPVGARSRARHDESRAASRRDRDLRRWTGPSELRLSGRAAPRGAGAAAGRGGADPRAQRVAAAPAARRRSLRAGLRTPSRPGTPARGRGANACHGDVCCRAPGGAGSAARGLAGRGASAVMERIDADVRRELARFDDLPPAKLQRIVEIWPEAVGPTIAANAWPARLARDDTLHVATSSSVWAFELGQLSEQIAEKLGADAPDRLRFAAGHLPESSPEPPSGPSPTSLRPAPEDERAAAEVVAGIDDEDLRKKVAKAAALSLARLRSDRCF